MMFWLIIGLYYHLYISVCNKVHLYNNTLVIFCRCSKYNIWRLITSSATIRSVRGPENGGTAGENIEGVVWGRCSFLQWGRGLGAPPQKFVKFLGLVRPGCVFQNAYFGAFSGPSDEHITHKIFSMKIFLVIFTYPVGPTWALGLRQAPSAPGNH